MSEVDTVAEAIQMAHMGNLGVDTYRRMAQAAIDSLGLETSGYVLTVEGLAATQ